MSDSDLIDLYSGQILALATDIPNVGRLANPDGTARRRAPLCGSTLTVDVMLDGERVSGFGQDVKACALGQAAASVVGAVVIGRSAAEIRKARDQLDAMLRAGGPVPDPPFDGLRALLPARAFANRHGSIMLALQATCDAIDDARAARRT